MNFKCRGLVSFLVWTLLTYCVALACGVSCSAASAATATPNTAFSGWMRVGAERFLVHLEMQDRPSGCWLSVAVTSEGGTVGRIAADLDDQYPTYLVDGKEHALDSAHARSWSNAVRSDFLSVARSESFTCAVDSSGERVYESQSPVALTKFMSARIRLVYGAREESAKARETALSAAKIDEPQLEKVEIYSITDWFNGFGDNVMLSLTRLDEAGEVE